MSKLNELKAHLKKGTLYRRAELERWSKSVDRHIAELVSANILKKVGPGLYYYPKTNAFGIEPPTDHLLVKKFLDDTSFLITSFNSYNAMGLGTTQLYNKQTVYNHLRSGNIRLGNKLFQFRKKAAFPEKPTAEFLAVDLVNNIDSLAEDQSVILEKVIKKVRTFDKGLMQTALEKYATPKTRRILSSAK